MPLCLGFTALYVPRKSDLKNRAIFEKPHICPSVSILDPLKEPSPKQFDAEGQMESQCNYSSLKLKTYEVKA
jgi:hypothetical protein